MRKMVVALATAAAVRALALSAGADTAETTHPAGTSDQARAEQRQQSQPQPGQPRITGTLRYEQEGEDVFAEGVSITVESADGSFEQTVESDADGKFEVPVPGAGSYTVTLDEDTLPEDVGLRNDRPSLT